MKAGARFEALFCFSILPVGDYSICVAVAEGAQMDQLRHQMHDAVLFRSPSSGLCNGLIGIPMHDIQLWNP
jgi:lipopolysaccharide transport system ATP-binding protein